MAPDASRAADGAFAKSVPLVPREMATRPSTETPQPSADIMLSPPPAETGTPAGTPAGFAWRLGGGDGARGVGWALTGSSICAAR